jgi:hypothetical protein
MEPLKILIINTVPMTYNGITMMIMNYVLNMNKSGLQIDFVAINHVEDSLRELVQSMGSNLYELPMRSKKQIVYLNELRKTIRKEKYTIVHAHGNSDPYPICRTQLS